MMMGGRKLFLGALLVVLVFGFATSTANARRLEMGARGKAWSAMMMQLIKGTEAESSPTKLGFSDLPSSPSLLIHSVKQVEQVPHTVTRMQGAQVYPRLPKGVPIPPSGPSAPRPHIDPFIRGGQVYPRLPKGVPIPPSGPSAPRPHIDPFMRGGQVYPRLPKGVPIPPSGPSAPRPPVVSQMRGGQVYPVRF